MDTNYIMGKIISSWANSVDFISQTHIATDTMDIIKHIANLE